MGKGRLKQAVSIFLILLLVCSTGCSKTNKEKDVANQMEENKDLEQSQTDSDSSLEKEEDEKESDITGEDVVQKEPITIPELDMGRLDIPDNEGMKFVSDMKVGWNLGNTFDAVIEDVLIENELTTESAWSGVKTTREMIQTLKNAGFKTIRIPVSWHNHLIGNDYEISKPWLERVKEVVDYAIDEDMYVILNIHHDISTDYYYPDKKHMENSSKFVTTIWKQLANTFQDYDNQLIFESINEPRLVGTDNEWWLDSSKENCKEAIECINELNQIFVDIIRDSGGNNKTRYLLVPGYCASADGSLNQGFLIPEDKEGSEHKIIISVHAYTPYNFALQAISEAGNTDKFRASDATSQKDIKYFMDGLYDKYISKGVPVLIGEFGARDKNGNLQDRVDYTAYYAAYAKARGMICCWWDNNAFSGDGENFGLFDRKTLTFRYPDILNALMKYSDN